ncbi:hypothetical protein [Saccharopolyspora sp. CA-218241]|uniref:hypothetical protein n=1 Tax=Saccharopolyspora sp. CA-218241 TaxID=3240027 RepID=UPI003D9695F8
MNATHSLRFATPAMLFLGGAGVLLGDLLFGRGGGYVWDELGVGMLLFALVAVSYELDKRRRR